MVEDRKLVVDGRVTFREWTRKQIDDELRENGWKVNMETLGYAMQRWLGFEMVISPRIAKGKFVVSEKISEPNGQLMRGIPSYLAESIGSAAGACASHSRRIAGIELNLNNLHHAYVGQEVTVIAKLLRQNNRIQTWEIKFETEDLKGKSLPIETQADDELARETILVAIGRLTLVEQNLQAGQLSKLQEKLLQMKAPSSRL